MRVGNSAASEILKNTWNRELGAGSQEAGLRGHVDYSQLFDPSALRPLI
jgi:hypothetical protein